MFRRRPLTSHLNPLLASLLASVVTYSTLLPPLETQCMERNYALISQEIKVGLHASYYVSLHGS